jgi:hypothetical protein
MKYNLKFLSLLLVLLIVISGISFLFINFDSPDEDKEINQVPNNIWEYQNQKNQPNNALLLTFSPIEWEAHAAATITPAFIDRAQKTPIMFDDGFETREINIPHDSKKVNDFGSDLRSASEKIAMKYWSKAEVVIISDTYEHPLQLVPIASYLLAPILINPSENILQILGTKCVIGTGSFDTFSNIEKTIKLDDTKAIWKFQLDLYTTIDKKCDYVIITNPTDIKNDRNENITFAYLSVASAPLAAFRNALVVTGDYTIDREKTNKIASAGKPYEDVYLEIEPSFKKVKKDSYRAEKYLIDHGHDPKFLALVGGSYAVPDYIFQYSITYFYWSAKSNYLFSPAPYGDISDKNEYIDYPKQELEVGRIIGHSILDSSVQLTRTFFYEDFLSNGKYRTLAPLGWEEKAAVVEGHRVNQPNAGGPALTNDAPYFPAGEINDLFSGSGYDTTYYLPRNVSIPSDKNKPINAIMKEALNSSLILINAHGGDPGKQALLEIGLDTDMNYEYTYAIDGENIQEYSIAPSIVYLIGCDTGSIAFDFQKDEYLTLGFIHSGAVAYLAPETYQTICFWDKAPYGPEASQAIYFFENIMKKDTPIGEALLDAKWKSYEEWEDNATVEDDVGPNTLKLYGDPAFIPHNIKQTRSIDSIKNGEDKEMNQVPTRAISENDTTPLTLTWDESKTINGKYDCGDLTITDFGRLVLENAELTIRGQIQLEDYGSIFATNSVVKVIPQPMHEDQSVIYMNGNSIVRFFESDLLFEHSPSPTIAPFINSEGKATLLFINGSMNVKLPPLPRMPEQDYEIEPRVSGTAGVILLSEDTYWEFRGTDITVNALYKQINGSPILMSPWYMCSLLGNADIVFDDAYVNYNSGTKLLETVKGKITIKNSLIIGGIVSSGVTETIIYNSTVNGALYVSSRSTVSIIDSFFNGNVMNGVWSESEELSESKITIIGSTLNKDISCDQNSIIEVYDSKIEGGLNIFENGSIIMTDSLIKGVVFEEKSATGTFYNSSLKSVFLKQSSIFKFEEPSKTLETLSLYYDFSGIVTMTDSKIKRFSVYSDCDFQLDMLNSSISRLDTSSNTSLSVQLTNSMVETLANSGKNNNLIFNLKNSTIPELPKEDLLTSEINYQLDVFVSINDKPIDTEVEVFLNNNKVTSAITDELGYVAIPLQNTKTVGTNSQHIEDYTIKTSYLGHTESRDLKLNNSKVMNFEWSDITPPKISKVTYGPKTWLSNRQITVQAIVNDDRFEIVSNVTLVYSTNAGSTWSRINMQKVDPNTYEGIIPGHKMGANIDFYVESFDRAGNKQETSMKSYQVGYESLIILISFLIFIIITSILFIKKVYNSWITKRKYYYKYDKSPNVIVMQKNE